MTTFNTAIITRSHTSKMSTIDETTQLLNERDNKQLLIINPTTFHSRTNENCYQLLRSFKQYRDLNSVKEDVKLSQPAAPHLLVVHRAAAPRYRQTQWTGRKPGTPSPPCFMGNCFTCGRNGHISRKCFSRTGCRSTPQSRMRDAYRPPNSYTRNHHWLPRGPRNKSTYEGNSQPRQY